MPRERASPNTPSISHQTSMDRPEQSRKCTKSGYQADCRAVIHAFRVLTGPGVGWIIILNNGVAGSM